MTFQKDEQLSLDRPMPASTAFSQVSASRFLSLGLGWAGKCALDKSVAAVLLFLPLPLLVVFRGVIFASDGKAPIFRYQRIGRNGRRFG